MFVLVQFDWSEVVDSGQFLDRNQRNQPLAVMAVLPLGS